MSALQSAAKRSIVQKSTDSAERALLDASRTGDYYYSYYNCIQCPYSKCCIVKK